MFLKLLYPLYFVAVHSIVLVQHTCDRLHHGIGSFPWVSDLKFLLVRLRSSKSIKNDGADTLVDWLILAL